MTWTTPYDVSMARSAAASDSAGAVSAARKSAPVKWTWLFQKPAVTVPPEQSMILARGGTRTAPRAPTAVMVASSMRTTPSGITATSGDGITRPPTSAVTRPPAAVAGGGAVPHTAGSTAAVASAAAPRESRSRWIKRVIIEARFSPDQRRQINDLPAAEVLAKDKSLLTVTAKRVIWAPLYRTSVESCPTST